MQTKSCSKCKIEKPLEEYFKDKRREIGIRSKCKECCKQETAEWRIKNRSEYNNYVAQWRAKNPERQHKTEIKRRYGLTIEDYNQLLIKQDLKCKICGKQHDSLKKRGRLYVDHCHDTGKVRSLLCHNCNIGLGNFNHDISIMEKAIDYLKDAGSTIGLILR